MSETATKAEHPMQPLEYDEEHVLRFKSNAIVRFAVEAGRNGWKWDINTIAEIRFSVEDREQFAQLIGYSLSGFGELSYVRDATYDKAEEAAKQLMESES